MSSRRRTRLAVALVVSLAACGGGSNGGGGGGPTSGPDVDFAPTTSTSLSGSLTYKSIRIPAGVTVTGSADLTLTVVGDALIAGGLTAPCHALMVTAGGVLTVSGSVSNDCTVPAQRGSQLALIGKGGYDFEGAHITGSGNIAIVDGPNLNPQPQVAAAALRATPRANAGGPYRCKLVNTTVDLNPPQPKAPRSDGATDGADGLGYIDGCGQLFTGQTGGNLLINGLTVNGSDGLDGSDATGVASATGGNGGNAGPIALVSDEDIDITGTNHFNGGDGGRGGDATAANPAAGGNATATGGKGGSLKPPGGLPPVVIVSNQGTITVSGALNVTLGTGGRGGHANATSGDGASGGGKGGTATANGGDGGNGQAANINAAGAVTVSGSITVAGGGGGNGGDATISVGDGGPATTPGSPGGPGGNGVQRGGAGGKGVTNGALRAFRADGTEVTVIAQNAAAGNGGKATATKGNGKNGADNCPLGKGGDGGPGGAYSGGPGAGGDGTPKGTVGAWGISNAFNGLNGAKGATGGARGAAGTDGSSAPPGVTGYSPTVTNSFQPGQPGGACAPAIIALTLTPAAQTVPQGGTISVQGTFTRQSNTNALLATIKDATGATRGTATIPSNQSSFNAIAPVGTSETPGTSNWTVIVSDPSDASVTPAAATFQVTVTVPTGTAITLQNPDLAHPIIWFAIEHGNGPWAQLTSSNQTFSWTETESTGGFAFTIDEGNDRYRTWRILSNGPATEQDVAANLLREYGTNTVGGLLRGLNTNERAFATIGSNVLSFLQSGTADLPVVWSNQRSGTFDIFASRTSSAGDALKLLQMRGQVVPAGNTVFMDFGGSAAFNPFAAVATGGNFGSELWNVESGVWSQTGPTFAPFALSAFTNSITKNLWFLPPTLEQASDLEFLIATTPTRSVESFFHTPGNQTINFPSQVNPSLTWVGTRPRITLAFPSDVNQLVVSDIQESVGGATIELTSWVSTAFTGSTTTFDDVLPDWSSINFPTAAMFRSGGAASYSISAKGSNMANGALLSPREGLSIFGTGKLGTSTVP